METYSITYNNSTVIYRVTGTGKPVVLIHGFGEDGTVWQSQIDFLKNDFTVIIPDIPGSGRSEFLENANIETYAEVIKLILDAEVQKNPLYTIGEFAIIGHSMGGYITLALAEKYPQYLNSFGLFHSTAFADSEEKKEIRRKAIEFIENKGADAFFKLTTPALFTEHFSKNYMEIITSLLSKEKKFTTVTLIQYYKAMVGRPDRISVLRNFNNPILFIIGEHDIAIPLQSSLQQCYVPSKSYVTILDQSAHMGMWEEKDKANNILHDFLVNKCRIA